MTEAAELLRSYALARGWVAAGGLPDETRSGRQILKDFVNGKLLHCERPPGCSLSNAELGLPGQAMNSAPARQPATQAAAAVQNGTAAEAQPQHASSEDGATDSASDGAESVEPTGPEADAELLESNAGFATGSASEMPLSAADRELMQSLQTEGSLPVPNDCRKCTEQTFSKFQVMCVVEKSACTSLGDSWAVCYCTNKLLQYQLSWWSFTCL